MEAIIPKIVNALYSDLCPNKEDSRIYKIHKYWARKPWYIVEKYVTAYAAPGELVMDPFCGSGCTGLEAVLNGRNFIGQDLNPAALQVTRGTLRNDTDLAALERDFARIAEICAQPILDLYPADDLCPSCGRPMYFKYINIGPKFEGHFTGSIYCPHCRTKPLKRLLSPYELDNMREQNLKKPSKWVPDLRFPEKFYKDRFSYKGIHSVADMYTGRNLYALSLLYDAVRSLPDETRDLFLLAFTNTVLHVSKLKGEQVRPLGVNNYWIPDDYYEENVWFRFQDRVNNLMKAKQQQQRRQARKQKEGISYGQWSVAKKSALESMGHNCIDYFFTDPPYGEAIQYSELSFIWNAWLGETYDNQQEIIINPVQNKDAAAFQDLLSCSLDRIYDALKPQRFFTLCFQNKNSQVWKDVIAHCKKIGFQLVDVSIYDTYGNPFNKSWADFSPKSDIYVTFQKTSQPLHGFYNQPETLPGILREILAYTKKHAIPVDSNRLYDLTIAYLIWAMYLNRQNIDTRGLDIRKFARLVQDLEENTVSF